MQQQWVIPQGSLLNKQNYNMPKITVFTPSYNRAYILPKLYNSLVQQTSSDFEWVVVDDGSSDNTSELLSQWEKCASFPIKWQTQPNQGKHIAINTGVSMASGELFSLSTAMTI